MKEEKITLDTVTYLLTNLMKQYQDFGDAIRNMPGASFPRQKAFEYFDTGILWFKESIVALIAEKEKI